MGLLDGKVAIVTGAGRGVGRAEALALAKEGAKVVINDLDGTGDKGMVADQVVKDIEAMGGQAAADYSDVGTLEGVDNMIWRALGKFGRLDIMVHNAGILRDKTLLNMTEGDWDLVQKVHAKGTFLCTRAAGRVMKAQGEGGVIVNTSSMSGLMGNFGQSNYALAKAGVYGFTKTAAMELGRYGIRVHAVVPNAYTRMTADLPALKGVTEEMLDPGAMAPLVVFFASDLSKDLTGRVILAHGGTIGVKVSEFKMGMAEGFNKKDGLPTAEDIADNIDQVLAPDPDLNIEIAFKFD
ncbi:MAG: SDR family oxidoreductase [Deltaproteobacteria bacterium]|nr:SDR family oxidoreductase [Deltaproteobacteria bacterium]MBW1819313.1 SDR family oxidoreductase [Deltaproteobacteria bacterium]